MTTRTLLQNVRRRLPHYLDHNVAQCAGPSPRKSPRDYRRHQDSNSRTADGVGAPHVAARISDDSRGCDVNGPLDLRQEATRRATHRGPRSGKYVLRQAISLRVKKKENLQTLVQTIGVPQDGIIAFSAGADNLNEAQLSAVAMYVFGNASYSAEHDRLVSTAKPPTNMGVAPASYQPSGLIGVYPPPATARTEVTAPPPAPDMVEALKFKRPEGVVVRT